MQLREELAVLYKVRKEAFIANANQGCIKYVVNDLQIVELKTPRPLPNNKSSYHHRFLILSALRVIYAVLAQTVSLLTLNAEVAESQSSTDIII
uniref:Uncharacterized protein n=1 Tax=Caenorhabditis japonica TaxID=281687 RepID=A0A8R1ITG7_CAEJA